MSQFFLNEVEAAARLGLAATTLTRWRWAKKGPAYHKFGGAVRYSVDDLYAFVEAAK